MQGSSILPLATIKGNRWFETLVSGKVANFHCKRGVTGTLVPSRRIKRLGLTRRRFEQGPEAEVRVLSLQTFWGYGAVG